MVRAPRSGKYLVVTHTQRLDGQYTIDLFVRRYWFLEGQLLGRRVWAGSPDAPALRMPIVEVDEAIVDLYRSVCEVVKEH